jgi:hypothetical protein
VSHESENQVRRASIDPERLLPGENPDNPEPGDAQRWVRVYSELISTKRLLLASLRELMEGPSEEARDELERADIRMLELQIDRFEHRLRVWTTKLAARRP